MISAKPASNPHKHWHVRVLRSLSSIQINRLPKRRKSAFRLEHRGKREVANIHAGFMLFVVYGTWICGLRHMDIWSPPDALLLEFWRVSLWLGRFRQSPLPDGVQFFLHDAGRRK